MNEPCQQTSELASAYLDNELSATEGLAVQRHLRQCADCAREVAALSALSSKIKTQASYHGAATALMDRIGLATAPVQSSQPRARLRNRSFFSGWAPTAGAVVLAILVVAGALWQFTGRDAETQLSNDILSSHIRSTLSQQPFDVASSDRHTVKPWFSGKLNFAPPVIDLSAQGFVLQGGRLDFVDDRTVAAIVYGRRKHLINLYVWPSPGHSDRSPHQTSVNGFNLIDWQREGMRLSAISDLNANELLEFARQFATQSTRETPNP